jgi:hypothetical protein
MSWIAGLIATTAGKAAAGTVLAAASVGGLHAADVVELPVLPDEAAESNVETTSDPVGADLGEAPENADLPDEAEAGQARAEANRQAAEEFTAAMQAWTDCVADAAPESDTEEFDPVAACGERPMPSQADEGRARAEAGQANADAAPAADGAETGATNSEQGRTIAEQGESNADDAPVSDGTPAPAADDAGSQDPTDRGTQTPAG